ncbi:hypothetical protein PIB30_029524, partial [Stylosanthes scabra]|nr:hypothetical protein [Stylosanthes scabra]
MTAPFPRPSVSPAWKKVHDRVLVMLQRELGVVTQPRPNLIPNFKSKTQLCSK